jgi:uroporphyrinogen decarboxylase
MQNDLFLRACRRQRVERTPVWIMRQAGRYLPEYRAIRAQRDFKTMCKTPELAAEVTVQPVDVLGVDAAILFSDILVVPEAMGMEWRMVESEGPRFPRPIRTRSDIENLIVPDPEKGLRFVLDAIGQIKRELDGRVPLIGFSGAPWTLATYMIEGGGSAVHRHTKTMMLDEPESFLLLMNKIEQTVRLYLEAQIAAGADALQLFDTWAGTLAPDHFRKFALDPLWTTLSSLHRDGAPVIVFAKGANHALYDIAGLGAEVVGVDWTVDLATAREITGDRVALQGNLDPSVLYASPESIRREVRAVLRKYGRGPGHIFNLGHGITPDVPVEHVRAMVRAVKEESAPFHA